MSVRTALSDLGVSLSRNKSMTISLVVTMTVSLLLAALGLLMQSQADRTERYYGDRLQVQVNLCTELSPSANCVDGAASDADREAVEAVLDQNPEVKTFEIRTPEQNFEKAKAVYNQNATGRKTLDSLTVEAFPQSYNVTLVDRDDSDGLQSELSGMKGVDSVSSLKQLLGPLFELLDKMRWAALGTSLVLIVAAVLQVSNTIRMTAYARRREIGIMRLVGASSWHIQLPFLLESLVAALASAVLACAGLAAFMKFVVYGYLRDNLGTITTWVSWSESAVVMGWTVVLALVLALVPTLVMTRKYLDV